MRINIFNSGVVSMDKVRNVANTSFPTVTLNYKECCKLAAQALMSAHVTDKELKQIFDGIKRVFRVETVDVKPFLPTFNEMDVNVNGVQRWAAATREIRNGLANMEWEV